MLPKFDASNVWSHLLGVNMSNAERPTVFMGVPTIYSKLISEYENKFASNPKLKEYVKATCSSKMRYFIGKKFWFALGHACCLNPDWWWADQLPYQSPCFTNGSQSPGISYWSAMEWPRSEWLCPTRLKENADLVTRPSNINQEIAQKQITLNLKAMLVFPFLAFAFASPNLKLVRMVLKSTTTLFAKETPKQPKSSLARWKLSEAIHPSYLILQIWKWLTQTGWITRWAARPWL